MSVVLRLDVPALERLLGGDTEVEVQLREGVVQEFAKRHLGAVLKDKAFAGFLEAERRVVATGLEALVHKHIGQIKTEPGNFIGRDKITVYLSEDIRAAIAAEAEKRVSEAVAEAVDEVWARREPRIVNEVYGLLAKKVDALTETYVKEQVQARLSKIATTLNGTPS